ncbi:MAG: Gfo/Idh/MocA family oxidoreductase [Bacteroidales bacterium]|nr:Gfo/Idh/MocA family oxidoreductase [Bacteroidales bacterium]
MANRKINMGMVGGGPGSFIGRVHYMAAILDGQIDLVCGAFSSNPEKSKITGAEYHLPPERVYDTYQEMITEEAKLPEGVQMDFMCIVTPNHLHFKPAKLAMENGFHVVCDKPLTLDADEAEVLVRIKEETGLLFLLTHTYTGYPMVKEARHLAQGGDLGKIRKVVVDYPQGWLSEPLEQTGHVQASWRGDPKRSGKTCCVGDIGTHAFHLAEYVTGLRVNELMSDLSTLVPNRVLDDDANMLLHFDGGARGVLYASQISAGEENAVKLRVYGEKGGMEWNQMEPNTLIIRWLHKSIETRRTGTGFVSPIAAYNTRVPAGHPEGYIEAFANLYRNAATCIQHILEGTEPPEEAKDFPSIYDGLRGMIFIDKAVESSEIKSWVEL